MPPGVTAGDDHIKAGKNFSVAIDQFDLGVLTADSSVVQNDLAFRMPTQDVEPFKMKQLPRIEAFDNL